MWFGDLVTMRWWDDLWLKESFATWAANFAVSEQRRRPGAGLGGVLNSVKTWAYRQDQLPSTHPIAADIVDLEAVEQNFDGITYAKGASVLVQLVAFVGREAFLRRRAGSTSPRTRTATPRWPTCWRALQRASGRDLSGWSAQWLETAGVNTLRLGDRRRTTAAPSPPAPSSRPPPRTGPDAARAPDRASACTADRRRHAGPGRADRDRHRRARGPRCPSWSD